MLSGFGFRVSVKFHRMFVNIIFIFESHIKYYFSSVCVAEWEPFGRDAHSVGHIFSLYFDYLLFKLFPVWGLNLGSICSSSWSVHTYYFCFVLFVANIRSRKNAESCRDGQLS